MFGNNRFGGFRETLRTKNIDSLVDILVQTQKENGIEPTMTEALFDPVSKERINMFRRKKLEMAGVDLSEYVTTSNNNNPCSKCKKKEERVISNIERGKFIYSEDDLIDEEEGEYICEYCYKIGSNGMYKPEECDNCHDCENCSDFNDDQCDGCRYSATYNDGKSYAQVTGISVSMRSEDEELINELEYGGPDYEVEKPTGKFSIMNY